MISEALRRGQAVEEPTCAALAAELAAAQQRTNRVLFTSAPVFLFVFQVLYLLHLRRSFTESVLQWQGIALAALMGLFCWYAWRQWATRLRRAEELNGAIARREKEAPS